MAMLTHEDNLSGALKSLAGTVWGYSFASLTPLDSELESYTKEVEAIKEKLKDMLIESKKEFTSNIHFINSLCRLGISYHFESEIGLQLNRIFTSLPKLLEDNDYDLSTLAILFRVLRQHGYKMTCDVFKKFKGSDGEFKNNITADVKGLIFLYEASFLAVHGETILEEALSFTKKHLEALVENLSPTLQKYIKNALILSSHQTMERHDILQYISLYEADESRNETLLKFAKLDFNRLQLIYRKELASLSKWWKDTKVVENLPYVRDRVAEAYIWAVGSFFEPQYSLARILICKHVLIEALVDDTYDSYGTFEELQRFTAAFQRFTADAMDELPEYMKFIYGLIFNFFEEMENSGIEGCSYKTPFAREMLKELGAAYLMEHIITKDGKMPSFDEYVYNGKVTSTFDFVTSAFFLGMENLGIKEIVWLRNDPPIVSATKHFGRLMNDVAARMDETKRIDCPKGLDVYMKEHGVSRDEAVEGILKLLDKKWKDMNEEMANPSANLPRILIKHAFNFARMAMVFYVGHDLYTYPSHMKELIISMFIDPLPI